MAARDRRRPRVLTTWGPVLLVLAVLAGGFATYQWDLGERWFGAEYDAPAARPGHRARRRTSAPGRDPPTARHARARGGGSAPSTTAGWHRARSPACSGLF